jgi:hypothetical protein
MVPIDTQNLIDAHLRHRRLAQAVVLLRDRAGLNPKPSLYEAQDIVAQRLRWLTAHAVVEPETPVTVDDLLGKVRAITAPVVAVEAVWDGDTRGWFVELLAIVERPGRRHPRFDEVSLAVLRHGGDIRLFNGGVPPLPEAIDAAEHGEALARVLGVPFQFASPTTRDDQALRWDQ